MHGTCIKKNYPRMFLPHNYVLNGQILLQDDIPLALKFEN